MIRLRLVTPEDTLSLLEIYRPYVEETPITFEAVPPAPEAFAQRIAHISAAFPYLVAEQDGKVCGYAYAHAFHEREAYGWSVETSIYLDRDCRGQGIGPMLYRALLTLLAAQGVRNVCAIVTTPNVRSERLHAAMGFVPSGVLPNFGYKLGQWHSVAYLTRALREDTSPPTPILGIHRLPQEVITAALQQDFQDFCKSPLQ